MTAPSRLHFGLLNLGQVAGRRFGGVGLMVDGPGLRLTIESAERFETVGEMRERVAAFAACWASFHRLPDVPPCRIIVHRTPRAHAGLGTGTQLGMSVAAGLNALSGWPIASAVELAASVGRGRRSAIGAHGFRCGGLLAERGSLENEPLAPLDCQLDLPDAWRVVLTCPQGVGLSGSCEEAEFQVMPPVPVKRSEQLEKIIRQQIFPAAARGDFEEFSRGVYRYGYLAGECFAASQGGPYNGPLLTGLVETIRSFGILGVGQSSWGPTVFALVPNQDVGARLVQHLKQQESLDGADIQMTSINRGGARVEMVEDAVRPVVPERGPWAHF